MEISRPIIVILAALLALLSVVLDLGGDRALSAPSELKVIPRYGNRIDLYWKPVTGEYYDIWQSTDGQNWQNIKTTVAPGEGSLIIDDGVQPYVNYYFLVSADGAVNDPVTDANSTNATYIGPGYPPFQHGHYFYLKDTNICANCHRPHRGEGKGLLTVPAVNQLCLTCHDGTQSKYNVLEGTVDADSNGDGYSDIVIAAPAGPLGSFEGHLANDRPESIHSPGQMVNTAPGGDPAGVGEEWEENLNCISCHDPHNSRNYRMLSVVTPDNANGVISAFAITDVAAGKERVVYRSGISEFCAGCHQDYFAGTGAGSTPASGTYSLDGRYRHLVGADPSSYNGGLTTALPLENDGQVICLTCHNSHGSDTNPLRQKAGDNDGLSEGGNHILRLDNDGACQECHQK